MAGEWSVGELEEQDRAGELVCGHPVMHRHGRVVQAAGGCPGQAATGRCQ